MHVDVEAEPVDHVVEMLGSDEQVGLQVFVFDVVDGELHALHATVVIAPL